MRCRRCPREFLVALGAMSIPTIRNCHPADEATPASCEGVGAPQRIRTSDLQIRSSFRGGVRGQPGTPKPNKGRGFGGRRELRTGPLLA